MEIETRDSGNIKIVEMSGNLDTNSANQADDRLKELVDAGATNIILNVGGLGFISSSGLRVLLTTAQRLSKANGQLVLTNLNKTVKEVFSISGFDTILTVCETEEQALQMLA